MKTKRKIFVCLKRSSNIGRSVARLQSWGEKAQIGTTKSFPRYLLEFHFVFVFLFHGVKSSNWNKKKFPPLSFRVSFCICIFISWHAFHSWGEKLKSSTFPPRYLLKYLGWYILIPGKWKFHLAGVKSSNGNNKKFPPYLLSASGSYLRWFISILGNESGKFHLAVVLFYLIFSTGKEN